MVNDGIGEQGAVQGDQQQHASMDINNRIVIFIERSRLQKVPLAPNRAVHGPEDPEVLPNKMLMRDSGLLWRMMG